MEIEFKPGRMELGVSQPASRRAPAASAGESASFEQTRALEQKLASLPETRPEQVARARTLIADPQYPPQEMVDRIANLLALHMKR